MPKYIEFDKYTNRCYVIRNKKSRDWLGDIEYYKPWKQYCVTCFYSGAVFNNQCLRDIADFLDELNKKARK